MKQCKELNRQIVLNARLHSAPKPSDFRLEQAPEAFIGLLEGKNSGKLVIQVG